MDKKVAVAAIIVAAIVVVAGVAAVLLSRGGGENEDTVFYTTMAPSLMDSWLAANQSSGYIAWEPYASSAVVAGTGRALLRSEEIMPNHPCCVVVVWNDFLAKDFGGGKTGKNLTVNFLKAHIDATAWVNYALDHKDGENYTKLVNMAVAFTQRSSAVIEEAFNHVKYRYEMNSSFRAALAEFTEMYMDYNLVTNQTIADRGYTGVGDFVAKYANGTYLEAAPSVTESSVILNPDASDAIRLGFLSGDLHQIAQVVALNTSYFGGKSMFEKYGLNVDPNNPYVNGPAEMTAFKLGEVDIGYLGAPPGIIKRLNEDTKTTIVAQANIEGSALIVSASSDVHSLRDLIGKTVATPGESSIQHLLLKIALSREGILFLKG